MWYNTSTNTNTNTNTDTNTNTNTNSNTILLLILYSTILYYRARLHVDWQEGQEVTDVHRLHDEATAGYAPLRSATTGVRQYTHFPK